MIRDLFFIRQLEKLKDHDWLRYFIVGYLVCKVYDEALEALKYSHENHLL
jgi:hypothetical protein